MLALAGLYRWAPLVGIYGGTIDVFRNMIAQYVLGLGRALAGMSWLTGVPVEVDRV